MSKSRVSQSHVVMLLLALVVVASVGCPVAVHAATYLHLSDIHLDTSGVSDDTDLALWKITKEKLRSILTGPDAPRFVLFTGDLAGHYKAAPCSKNGGLVPSQIPWHDANIETVLEDLHQLVAETGIPLLYTPGNNDALAGDYFSFTDEDGKTPFSLVPDDGYPAINASRPCGQPPCTVSPGSPHLGYYSARPVAGLRVIALNSIIWGRKYHPVAPACQHAAGPVSQHAAGDRQLHWLAAQLDDAAAAGDKVLLAMHIPPGLDAFRVSEGEPDTSMWTRHPEGEGVWSTEAEGSSATPWLDRFLELVAAHTDTIVGLAFGHTHEDELRRLHDQNGKITEVAISAPGITTNHGNNPGFKTVTYDPETKELLDFKTYYTERGNTTWGDEDYTFSELYGCTGQTTIFECLTSPRSAETAAVDRILRRYYTVMNGSPSLDPGTAIEVEHGQ